MAAPFSLLTLAGSVDELTGQANFHTWKDEILVVFNADGESADIVNGTTPIPADATEAAAWTKKDKAAMTIMWARMSKEVRAEAKGVTSGSVLYAKLKTKYEKSTWSRRVTLRTAFHNVRHDTTKPIEDYVTAVTSLRDQLEALGEKVSDNYFKDVLLANLNPLYVAVRNSLLAQPTGESDLATVKSVISGALYINDDNIKTEPEDTALAIRNGNGSTGGKRAFASSGSVSGRSGNSAAHTSGQSESHGIDKNGYRWCDPTNENHCHRCGRTNHIAARCVADMPKDIKAWVLNRLGSDERTNMVWDSSYVTRPPTPPPRPRPSSPSSRLSWRADHFED
uniref:CCHC-type domain-containing protein n=1 Tax=Mycena chlorophos TaxID=658473 RepID=A0ABQ0LEN5_MYCCL|nr:predicted protein [Mycena chlorophos]